MLGRPVPSRNVTAKRRRHEGALGDGCPRDLRHKTRNPGTDRRRIGPRKDGNYARDLVGALGYESQESKRQKEDKCEAPRGKVPNATRWLGNRTRSRAPLSHPSACLFHLPRSLTIKRHAQPAPGQKLCLSGI